jgi:ferritin-like metal-binding protein YciE
MKLHSLDDLFLDQLKDLYSAENQIIKALPKMAKAASSTELRNAFEEHLQQTKEHAERLEQIFDQLDAGPKGKKCKGMEGLIEEGKETLEDAVEPSVCDAALIAAAQRVEHYEIAAYGCARTYAQLLAKQEIAALLQQTLVEEKETDEKLTHLAEEAINVQAVGSGNHRA